MTKRKDPSEWGKPGRPTKPKAMPAELKRAAYDKSRKAEAAIEAVARSRAAVAARKEDARMAMNVVATEANLKYLEKDNLLAWLCTVLVEGLPVTKVVPCMGGYDLVDMQDRGASMRACELLLKTSGYMPGDQHLHVHGQAGQPDAAPKFVFIDHPNGRGPK